MFFGISNQTVEDLFHRPAIGAATVLVMELVDQIEKKAMFLVDVLNLDAILVSPAQKSHSCSRSSVDRPLPTPPKKKAGATWAPEGESSL